MTSAPLSENSQYPPISWHPLLQVVPVRAAKVIEETKSFVNVVARHFAAFVATATSWLGLGRPDLPVLQRQLGRDRFELLQVFLGIHAALEQLERLDAPLELAALGVERPQLRVGWKGGPVARGAERQHRRHLLRVL